MGGTLSNGEEPGPLAPSSLKVLAEALADAQAPLTRAPTLAPPFGNYAEIGRVLARSARAFRAGHAGAELSHQKAGEWLLDNFYICDRALRHVRMDLPVGFRRRLPHVAGVGEARVLLLARAIVREVKLELDQGQLLTFLHDYQSRASLTVAELWALPTILRLAVLESLVQTLRALWNELPPSESQSDMLIDPALGVERSIRALRLLSEIDWKVFFRSASLVEEVLTTDPAKVYSLSDFETCDACRKVVEEIAWTLRLPEPDVARVAVRLAEEHATDPRLGHVGYYLIGEGRRLLDAEVGYSPPLAGERIARTLRAHPTASYLGALNLLALVLGVLTWVIADRLVGPGMAWLLTVLAFIPVTSVATTIAHRFFTAVLAPRPLPKLDLGESIPPELRTAIVIPALVKQPGDVDDLLGQLQVLYLSHPDPSLVFVLLADHVDTKEAPDDTALLEYAETKLRAMNQAHGKDGKGPFHVLYRESRWNPAEERYMGWERKRGKLWEWNKLIRGDKTTSFTRRFGDEDALQGIRYVITLDADTHLPLGAARRLIGLMAHPLNRPVFDERRSRVVSGYTVVQPRVETSPLGARSTFFARARAGDTAIDIYTNAVSDVYQDLFGAGIYVGKGIYDVDAFMRSLDGRVPENALTSHDLFEGSHGRAGLATDVVLFEEYPHHFLAFVRRQHRWVRGDWQLLPWIFGRVPGEKPGERLPNVLSPIDRFKIADNLRRSLFAPSLLVLCTASLLVLPSNLAFVGVLPLVAPLVLVLFSVRSGSVRDSLGRYAIYLLSLPHEAWTVVDAIVRVTARSFTKKHRLEWVTAAHTARSLRESSGPGLFYREMAGAVAIALALGLVLLRWAPGSLPAFAPFLVLWLLAPEALRRASLPPRKAAAEELPEADRHRLGRLARRTWYFFESFVGPGDQWLPPDNFQAHPRAIVAHRTSPTNIGLLLVAELSAHDFGYIGPKELSLLLGQSMGGLMRMERYAGHWLNWYGTKDLTPLTPRYVSTVDSGNLCASLIVVAAGCEEATRVPILGARRREGLTDTVRVLEESRRLDHVKHEALDVAFGPLDSTVHRLAGDSMNEALSELIELRVPELSDAIVSCLSADRNTMTAMKEARIWIERLDKQARSMRHDHVTFFSWLEIAKQARELGLIVGEVETDASTLSLVGVVASTTALLAAVEAASEAELATSVGSGWKTHAMATLSAARDAADRLQGELRAIGERARTEACSMDYRFLYDAKRRLFHTGYNVTSARLDPSYYDLLASEARVASFIAIMLHQVPVRHWFALGRPVTRTEAGVALLSWGSTMFEYLLPSVFMRSQPGTLIAESERIAVETQVEYGRKCGTPWGISESSFAQLDAQDIYQYRSFGVPGLGLRRGLEDDLVVAPYASILGLPIRPRAVMDNLTAFAEIGAMGTYGLYEAIDYRSPGTEDLLEEPHGAPGYVVVRSHMAHHQGMILAALNNALHADTLVSRFHSDPLVNTAELLLSERVPSAHVVERAAIPSPERPDVETVNVPSYEPWSPVAGAPYPELLLLTNGRLTSMVSDTGGGDMRWRGMAITAPCVDATRDAQGTFIYIRDRDSGAMWSATAAPTRPAHAEDQVSFSPHCVETHERQHGISARMEVGIAQLHDVEIRHLTLHNESDTVRNLTVSSYLEPVLESAAAATRHPAFSRMFVECDVLPSVHGVLCERRRRSPDDASASLVHRLVWEDPGIQFSAVGTDRHAFIGRRRSMRSPAMQHVAERISPLEPAVSLEVNVIIQPGATVEIAWVTSVAEDRLTALDIAKRFGTMHAVRWVIRDAERECARRLHGVGLPPALLRDATRLWSRLLAPAPFHGAPAAVRRTMTPTQQELWGHGISGDFPILAVHIEDPDATPLAREVLAAFRYMRACGVMIDVVFLDGTPSGYQAAQEGNVRAFLVREGAAPWLHQRGGLFVLAKDRLGEAETQRLECAAEVVLFAARGGLAVQWDGLPSLPAPLPRLGRTRPPEHETPELREGPAENLLFTHPLGGFSPDGREYVIRSSPSLDTPAPWSNVLANPELGCIVTESSLGSTWCINAGENRLTPWRNDPTTDEPVEALYLRDEETAEVWSATPLPASIGTDFQIRHGAGHSTFAQTSRALSQHLTVFVPPDAPVKILRLHVKNLTERPRRLTVTHYAEWLLGATRSDNRAHVLTELEKDVSCILARTPHSQQFRERVAFLTCDRAIHGFTCDRTEFIGRSGDYALPDALTRWGLCSTTEPATDPCAALQTHVDLSGNEDVIVYFVLGQGKDREEALELARRYRDARVAEEALAATKQRWDQLLSAITVKTPEPAMDLMVNRWFLQQAFASRFFARAAYYQSSGAFGFRDQLQDVMAFLHAAPEMCRAQILLCAAHQFEEGDVLHWWHPPADAGVRTHCSDDYLWLPYVTAYYVEATGDVGILEEQVSFLTARPLDAQEGDRYAQFPHSRDTATLLEHCRRALEHGFSEGPHGLPLIGHGDWNDGMNRVGKEGRGESVWLAWFLIATTNAFIRLLSRVRPQEDVAPLSARVEKLRVATEACAWDGAWYVRAFYDDGTPIGTKNARTCRIDSIAQSWSVMSGAAEPARAREAMRSAESNLVKERERLVLLLTPPFQEGGRDAGYIQAYPPGVRENGGQYTHAATWLGFAHAKLGDGAAAYRILCLINPVHHVTDSATMERYRIEPYVLAGDVYYAHGVEGQGGWSWYTGAASWAYRLGVEAILGIARVPEGLRVDPCIPSAWPGFEATVRVGSRQVHLRVDNPNRVSRNVASMTVNGEAIEGNVVVVAADHPAVLEVRVVLGEPSAEAKSATSATMPIDRAGERVSA